MAIHMEKFMAEMDEDRRHSIESRAGEIVSEQVQIKRKRGRPRKANKENRVNTMFRLPASVHAKVWEAAESSGRSLSEELERRIIDTLGPNEAMKAAIREVLAERIMTRSEIHIDAGQAQLQSLGASVAKHLRHLNVDDESALFINNRPPDKWPCS